MLLLGDDANSNWIIIGVVQIFLNKYYCFYLEVIPMASIGGSVLPINSFVFISSRKGKKIVSSVVPILSSKKIDFWFAVAFYTIANSCLFCVPTISKSIQNACT